MDVRLMRTREIRTASLALAAAFDDDPFTTWMLPDPAKRAKALPKTLALQLRRVYLPKGHVYTVEGAVGAALWSPPGRWKLGFGTQLALGPAYARIMGLRTAIRAGRAFAEVEERHPEEPHWYLAILGVDPAAQGEGVGTALLGPVLELSDAGGKGCYLDTSNPANPAWYERHGFTVREEFDIPDGPHMWTMWRPSGG